MQTLNNTTEISVFREPAMGNAEYYLHYVLGPLMGVLTVVGIFFNTVAVVTLCKHKCLRSRITLLLSSLAVSDGIMSVVGGTMYTINCFHHRWVFKNSGCVMYSFIMYWLGETSIAHLCCIAIERTVTLTHPAWSMARRSQLPPYIYALVVISWLYGFILAVLPFAGIQNYTIEGRISCSLDWANHSPHFFYYNIALFIFGFFIPVLIIITCNTVIFTVIFLRMKVWRAGSVDRQHAGPMSSNHIKKTERKAREAKLAKVMAMAAGTYIIAWTPYAIVCLWATFGDPNAIPRVLFPLLAFFAKQSFVFNPIVYIGTNPSYRSKAIELIFRGYVLKSSSDDVLANTPSRRIGSLRFLRIQNSDNQHHGGTASSTNGINSNETSATKIPMSPVCEEGKTLCDAI